MRTVSKCLATLVVLLLPATVFAQAHTQEIVYKVDRIPAVAGESHSWFFDVRFQAMGQDASFTGTMTRKVLKIDANGDVTWESSMPDGKVVVAGTEMEQAGPPSTSVVDKNGVPDAVGTGVPQSDRQRGQAPPSSRGQDRGVRRASREICRVCRPR